MPLPVLLAGSVIARKLAAKAVRWATKGRMVGAGGGRIAAGRAATAAGTVVGTVGVYKAGKRRAEQTAGVFVPGTDAWYEDKRSPGFVGGRGRYQRMQVTNMRALKRSLRRIQGFEKLARQVFTISKGTLIPKKKRSCR